MAKLGTVKWKPSEDGYERRERLDGLADCPDCGAEIELWSDTEEWIQCKDGTWRHNSYGPSQGMCEKCDILIVDSFDGCHSYRLRKNVPEDDR